MLIENHGSEAKNRPDFRDHQRSDVEKTKKVDGIDRNSTPGLQLKFEQKILKNGRDIKESWL